MKLFATLIFMILISVKANAQTFICTDIISDFKTVEEEQEAKLDMLGSILELQIFDNDIKISIKTKKEIEKNSKRDRSAVYTKDSYYDYYEVKHKDGYSRIELETFMGFIKGLKLIFKNGDKQATTIFKRKI